MSMKSHVSVEMSSAQQHPSRSEQSVTEAIELDTIILAADNAALPELDPVIEASDEIAINHDVAWKIGSCCFSFLCAGVDGGSLGTLLPYFKASYGATLGTVTIVYAATFAGWCVAGLTNTTLIRYFSFGSILIVGAAFQILSQALRAWPPSFEVYCLGYFFSALGTAYQDSQCNTYISTIKNTAHRWLGVIHAMYSVGMLIAPFVANSIASRHPSKWSSFYLFTLALDLINLISVVAIFRDMMRKPPVAAPQQKYDSRIRPGGRIVHGFKDFFEDQRSTLTQRGVWQLSLWCFFYTAAARTNNGWLVEFLVTVRHGNIKQMGYAPTAAFGGAILGRFALPDVFVRIGERKAVFIACMVYGALQIVFWFVPNIPINIAAIGIMGFIAAPFFPVGISIGSKLFSSDKKASALGLLFIAAQAGGALLPTITGLIAERAGGVRVLQPIVLGLILATAATWLFVPRPPRRTD